MPGGGPEDTQNPLIHEGADPDRGHDPHGAADRRAKVVQPDGRPLEDTAQGVEVWHPQPEDEPEGSAGGSGNR